MGRNTKNRHTPEITQSPRVGNHDNARRVIRLVEQPALHIPVGWNFDRMDAGGKFRCSLKALNEYITELLRLEGKTVEELMDKEHNHPMPTSKLSREARERMDVLNLDEQTLFQLDLKTPARLWGVLEHNIFHIIWLDKNHEVYLTKKP